MFKLLPVLFALALFAPVASAQSDDEDISRQVIEEVGSIPAEFNETNPLPFSRQAIDRAAQEIQERLNSTFGSSNSNDDTSSGTSGEGYRDDDGDDDGDGDE